MRAVVLMIISVLSISCHKEQCKETIDPIKVSIEDRRLEKSLFEAKNVEEIENVLKNNERFATLFLDADQYPNVGVLANKIFGLTQNVAIDTLYKESIAAFNGFEDIKAEIEDGFGRLKAYYPETKTPTLYTSVTGFYKDLIITNEEIIIGLEYFIGADATFKPKEIPDYILRRYNTEHLSSIILKFVSSQYVKPSKGETLIAEMIDHGKSLYLLSKLLPCTPENILMGYTKEEWEDVFTNDKIIWANFVQNQWIYSTDHTIKQKFIGERPKVYEIGEKCPGRIGAWLGWQIVKNYVKNTNVSIHELMNNTDHNSIFSKSRYKPGS